MVMTVNKEGSGGASDMRSNAPSVNTNCGVMNAMNSLNQLKSRKQFRCLPATKNSLFQYVEIITSVDLFGNYQKKKQLVGDRKKLETEWGDFYFRSKGDGNDSKHI